MDEDKELSLNNYEPDETYSSSPEKNLLANVLERALRDLGPDHKEHYFRRDAIAWFLELGDYTNSVSYKQVKIELELNTKRLVFISKKVKEAEEYEQRRAQEEIRKESEGGANVQKKRRLRRKGISSEIPGVRLRGRRKNGAKVRKGRSRRHKIQNFPPFFS